MKRKVILILIGIVLISYIVNYKWQNAMYESEKVKEMERIEEIANKLGVTPSWESIVEYIDCNILIAGKMNQDVLIQIQEIGDIKWPTTGRDNSSTNIYFAEDLLHINIGIIVLNFDDRDELMTKSRHYELDDTRDEYCPFLP